MHLGKYIASLTFCTLLLILISSPHLNARQNSIFAQGKWAKITVREKGIYKIDRSTLASMGFNINEIDPRNIQIYGLAGGMLPQTNSSYTTLLSEQLSIQVTGEKDGSMDPDDIIMFYADAPDRLSFTGQTYRLIKNLYSEEISYFITVGSSTGRRVNQTPNMQGTQQPLMFYDRIISHEEDLTNILGSGREWYGEQLNSDTPLSFPINTNDLVSSEDIFVSFTGMSQSFISSSFALELNGQSIGEVNFNAIPDARYGTKGNERSRTIRLNSTDFPANSDFNLSVIFNKNGASNAVAYINRFLVELPTALSYSTFPFNFRAKASLKQSTTAYQITASNPEEVIVWDVTNPLIPSEQETIASAGALGFSAFSSTLREYCIFRPADLPLVSEFTPFANQDLAGLPVPEMLIVTNDLLRSQAQRLADFRSVHDNLSVAVVTINEVYNEFSAGRADVSAIRNLARFLKEKNSRFKYLLLFGKGSYDYKDRVENNTNLVPTYEARNSLHPLLTYSSDDYFGFLDQNEGLWAESSSGDHIMDIGVGRIPATTIEQATVAVDKIITYQTDPSALGDWRSRLVFLADDGDNNTHQKDADFLATLIDTTYQSYNVTKLYLDAFNQETRPNGEFSPEATNALLDEVDKGALIINFTGHGSETGWTQERVLTTDLIDEWDNSKALPLLVTATCEFGRNDDPSIFSGAEKMIFKSDGGALALVTTARPVFSSTNYDLNLALYRSILKVENGEYPRLGDVIRFTKNNSLSGSLNRNFILLGDPGMRIAYPTHQISIQSINQTLFDPSKKDTLKALQPVVIEGAIEANGQTLTSFNGTVSFNLFDKNTTLQTKGTESSVFEYQSRNSSLFNGTATVVNGLFRFEFVVPKNIDYQFGRGKMAFYAINEEATSDALGASIDFILGGTDENAPVDRTPPGISAFLNDTNPVDQYVVKPDADLVLLLQDESGINISRGGIGQNIEARLNDSVTYILNDFYTTKKDDFTSGNLRFPLRGLPLGRNTLEISAWDTHNNIGTATLEFSVTEENSTTISKINAYPNPFKDNMTFSVYHNSAGQSIELVLEVFNQKGEKVTAIYQTNDEATNIEEVSWNGKDNSGSPLPAGVYIYNVLIKSENSELVHSSRQKLIISN